MISLHLIHAMPGTRATLLVLLSVLIFRVDSPERSPESVTLTMEEVAEQLVLRAERMGGVDATFVHNSYKVDDTLVMHEPHYGFMYEVHLGDGKRWVKRSRLRPASIEEHTVEEFVWDGLRSAGFTESLQMPPNRRYGGVIGAWEGGESVGGYWLTPIEQRVFDFPMPLSELLLLGRWQVMGIERVQGYECVIIQGEQLDSGVAGAPGGRCTVRAALATTHDFVPVSLRYRVGWDGVQEMGVEMNNVRLSRSDTQWVIEHAEIVIDNPNVGDHVGTLFETNTFTFSKYRTGVQVGPERFVMRFPSGTGVFDDVSKTPFIAGRAIYVQRDDGLVELVPMESDDPLQEWTDPTRGITDEEWEEWWAAVTTPVASSVNPPRSVGDREWLTEVGIVTFLLALVVVSFGSHWYSKRRSRA